MAEWKGQVSYNYNPSYHSYAYGLMYPPGPGPEQSHGGNLSGWAEAGVTENYNPGMPQAYYATTARTREEPLPHSPEQQAANAHCNYQGSGVVYLGDAQAGRLLLAGPHRPAYDTRTNETVRPGNDSTSDSEAHKSPDSWSSGSSREVSLPPADPATWAKTELDDETDSRSPDPNAAVSSSHSVEPQNLPVTGNESTDNYLQLPISTPKKQSTTAVNSSKGKARTAFSEGQMNALVQRFSVQRYLTPTEMKNMAEVTGLTYKQVKTWFQNRRMKLRRHQKDNSWVAERYTNKGNPIPGTIFTNMPPHMQAYQGEAHAQHYNQGMVDVAAFKKTAPQNLAFYLAATGSGGYPPWPPNPAQNVAPTRPQAASWPMPPSITKTTPTHSAQPL